MRHLALLLAALLACGPGTRWDDGATDDAAAGPSGSRPSTAPSTGDHASPSTGDHASPSTSDPVSPSNGDPVSPSVGDPVSPSGPGSPATVLGRYDFREPARRFDLPGRLDEISGLALTVDGRLLGHDDERGRIHEIDGLTGEVGKSFDLGSGEVTDDFEGIAAIGERLFLVSSRGFLYEFREGDDGADVGYRVTNPRLGGGCEVEGLDYDAQSDALVFACKSTSRNRESLVLHRLPVDPAVQRPPPVLVPRSGLEAVGLDPNFQPSALLSTTEGTFLLLSAATESILEISRQGDVLAGWVLGVEAHPQPEGIAMDASGTLYIADEENDDDARITAYTPLGGDP